MANNITVLDANEEERIIATEEVGGVHFYKNINEDIGDTADAFQTDQTADDTLIAFTKGQLKILKDQLTELGVSNSALASIAAEDFATETTVNGILSYLNNLNKEATQLLIKAKTDNIDIALSTLKTSIDAITTAVSAMSAKLPATLGQKLKAQSLSVTLATDQDNATGAKQDTGNTSLVSIDTKLGEVQASPTANTLLDRLKTIATNIVNLATSIVIQAGENFIGAVGGKSVNVTTAITTTSTQYTSGDCVGGVLTISAARSSGKQVFLQSLHIKDASNQKQPLTILIFDSDPTGGTGFVATDNSAFAYGSSTTTYAKQIGKINVLASDYETIDGKATAVLSGLGRLYTPSGSSNLYAVIITTGTPTYGANSTSLSATWGFIQD